MINCCNGCVPPKRTPTCHATCKEYKDERAALDETNAEINKQKAVEYKLKDTRLRAMEKIKRKGRGR